MLLTFPKYILTAFLREWLSPKDLLKLLSARPAIKNGVVSDEITFVYALTALFLKNKTDSDLKCHKELLARQSNNALFMASLDDSNFIKALKSSLRSMAADGSYRYTVLNAWTHHHVTHPSFEIYHYGIDMRRYNLFSAWPQRHRTPSLSNKMLWTISMLSRYLTTTEIQSFIKPVLNNLSDAPNCVAYLISELETAESQPFIELLIAKLNHHSSQVRYAALKSIHSLINKLETPEIQLFIEPILAKLNHNFTVESQEAFWVAVCLIPKLETIEAQRFQPLIKPMLEKLNDKKYDVRFAALCAIIVLIPILEAAEVQSLIEHLFVKFNGLSCPERYKYLDAIIALIPKITRSEIQSFIIKPLLFDLNDENSGALTCIQKLIPYLETIEVLSFIEPLAEKLRLSDKNHSRCSILQTINVLIHKLDNAETQLFIEPLLMELTLNSRDAYCVCAALDVIATLISKLNTTEAKRFIKPLLAKLNHRDAAISSRALKPIAALFPKLGTVEVQLFIGPIIARLNDHDKYVSTMALMPIAAVVTKLETAELQPFIEPILEGLSNEYSTPRSAALNALAALLPKLEATEIQHILNYVLKIFTEDDINARITALKVEALLLIDEDKEPSKEIIQELNRLDEKRHSFLTALNLLVPMVNEADLDRIYTTLMQCLNNPTKTIRKEAFNGLSSMIVYHPQYAYTFDNRNTSKEMAALIKMREMLAVTQVSDKINIISYSKLHATLNTYKTKSLRGQLFNNVGWLFGCYQSQTIMELQLLLAMKKLVYTKNDIETALYKGRQAEHRVRLFKNEEAPRLDSGTDELISVLTHQFQNM